MTIKHRYARVIFDDVESKNSAAKNKAYFATLRSGRETIDRIGAIAYRDLFAFFLFDIDMSVEAVTFENDNHVIDLTKTACNRKLHIMPALRFK